MTHVPDSQRHHLLLLVAVLLAAVPVLFGPCVPSTRRSLPISLARGIGHCRPAGGDVRGYRGPGPARVSRGRALGAIAAGAGCAAATAIFLGATGRSGDSRGRVRALHWDQHGTRHRRAPTANAVNFQRPSNTPLQPTSGRRVGVSEILPRRSQLSDRSFGGQGSARARGRIGSGCRSDSQGGVARGACAAHRRFDRILRTLSLAS